MNWNERLMNHYYVSERFVRFVIYHFFQDGCTYIASALAFTSLLAVVPLMTVGLTVFSSFPVFQNLALPVQDFIFENFVPATGKVIQAYLQQFASQVSKLSLMGVIFLLITALLVLFTIEQAMNKIWRVRDSRKGVQAFLLYWSILSFAPIILGFSLAASSYLFSIPLIVNHYSPSFFLHWSPFLFSLIGFTFLFVVVPNCIVKIRHAFWGGLFSAVLFESAKHTFAYFLIQYNTYELLYGAFAAVPIFFIWVYWVWIITLLGAEISYALSVHHQRRFGKPLDGFSHALLWLYELWKAQHHGKGLDFNQLVDANLQPFAVDVDTMLLELTKANLIHVTAHGEYMLSRDISNLNLLTMSELLPFKLPSHDDLIPIQSPINEKWQLIIKQKDDKLQSQFRLPLHQLFEPQSSQDTNDE